jgi:hypothetical protein
MDANTYSMKIEIVADDWADRAVGRADQARRSQVAKAIRDIASRIENGGWENGEMKRAELTARYAIKLPGQPLRADLQRLDAVKAAVAA